MYVDFMLELQFPFHYECRIRGSNMKNLKSSPITIKIIEKKKKNVILWFGCMMFNAVFNYISVMSWRSVLFVEETGVLRENHRPVASRQTLSHNVVSSTSRHERGSNSQL